MVIIEKVPRLEARLKLEVAGHPGQRRGLSDGNFLDALSAIPGLAAGLDEDGEALVARVLEWLVNLARSVRAIDEAEQWRPVRSRACPRCGCYFLRVLRDAAGSPGGRIECFGHAESGEPCRATWARLVDIVPELARRMSGRDGRPGERRWRPVALDGWTLAMARAVRRGGRPR